MAYVNMSKNAGLKANRRTKRKTPEYVNASKSTQKNTGGILGGFGYVGGRLGLGAAGVVEGITDVGAAAGDLITGNPEMAKYRFLDNQTAKATEKLENWYNPNTAMQIAGDVTSGVGNSLTFMIPYAGPWLAAAGYTGMGISSAAEKTGDVGLKEIGYGAVTGGMEFALDKLVGGAGKAARNISASVTRKLGREAAEAGAKATAKLAGKSFGKAVLTESFKGAAGEAAEEALSEAVDPLLQRMFNIDPNAEFSLRDVAYAGMIGAFSGGLMTAGPAAINYKNSAKVGAEIRKSGETQDFLAHTRRVLSAAQRKADKDNATATDVEAQKKAYKAAKKEGNTEAQKPEGSARKSKKAAKRVEDMAETVKKNLDTYEAYLQKADKTPKELEISDAVLGELRGNVFLLENASLMEVYEGAILELGDEDKQELVDEINRKAKASGQKKADYTVADLDNNLDDILTSQAMVMIAAEEYGVDLFQKWKGTTADPEETAQTPEDSAQGEEKGQDEQLAAEKEKPSQGRYTGKGEVRIEGGRKVKELGLSDEQYRAYKAAEILAPSLGVDIEIRADLTDEGGRLANGFYDPKSNTVVLNINAARNGKKIALYTLGHELTHYVKSWSPEKYQTLEDFVAKQMGEDFDTAVEEKAAFLERIGQDPSIAREEVVADSMELILTDGKVLEDLAKTDRSLWQKVKAWIQNTIDKIRKAYAGLNQASKTAQTLRETMETLEEVERLFTEGVREAGERARTAEVETEAEQESVENFSIRSEYAQEIDDENGKRYSIEDDTAPPDLTDREISDRDMLLAMAEQLVGNEQEAKILANYKARYNEQQARQDRLKELNEKMQELQSILWTPDSSSASRSDAAKQLQGIYQEMGKISEKMADVDRKLTEISNMKVIRNLLKREYVKARDVQKKKYKEIFERRKEAGETADARREVRRIYNRVNRMLFSPNRKSGIPYEMVPIVAEALKTSNMDVAEIERLAKMEKRLSALEREAVPNVEKIGELELQIQNQEKKVARMKEQIEFMVKLYEQTKNIKEGTGTLVFDAVVLEKLKALQEEIGNASIRNMEKKQLTALKDFYELIYTRITKANKTFATEKTLYVDDLGRKASEETNATKTLKVLSPKGNEWAAMDGIRNFFWKNMKPLTVFEAIGSKTFQGLFENVLHGEEVWAQDILEARQKIVEAREKHGYREWDIEERVEVKTKSGTVALSLSERMSLYAYSFREQAIGHLEGGGFVLDPKATSKGKVLSAIEIEKRLNDPTRYEMDVFTMGELARTLSAEQKAYVEEMQKYLTEMGEKGNEVSKKLYGIKLFTEEHYFPIKVKSEYLASHTGKSGDPNIKNRGMTKEVVPNAKDPLVLQGFDEIMVDHINSMATYHAFVLPVEDLVRVLNYKPVNYLRDENGEVVLDEHGMPKADKNAEQDFSTLKAVIESKYGAEANEYIVQLIRDLNGGARRDAAAGLIDRGITAFKRASTMASLSVLVQQPTSIIRAAAYIEPKYLFGNASIVDFKNHKELWERVKKYAPVAVIKEMGGYDTGVGARTGDYLNATEYQKGERLKGFLTDSDYRAEVFGKGAAYADEMAWIQLYEACVSEQADKMGKSRDSEEVLKAAGERFTEVVRHTQVYDSTLTRSEYMRSKDTGAKMATAFMAEPTTVVSMVAEAIMRGERGDVKFLRNTAGAVIGAMLLNAMFASLVYAMRDDDEDKSYGEKYISTLAMETAEGINPAEYFPVFRDIMSLAKGYEVERSDMALAGDLINSVRRITSSKQTVAQKMANTGGAVAAFFGLPVTNIMRDVNGMRFVLFKQIDTERFTKAGLDVAMKEEFDIMWGLWDEETTNGYQLYKATVEGDTKHFERVAARYESQKDVEMALRQALKDYDDRITTAAVARMDGELDVYEDLVKQIEDEGHFDHAMIVRAINNQVSWIQSKQNETVPEVEEEEDEEAQTESIYKTSDLTSAMDRGDKADFADVYDYLMTYRQEDGKTEAQARSSIKSSITSYWKKRYLQAWKENNNEEIKRIQTMLADTGLYGSRNDVAKMGQEWVKAYAASIIKK